MNWSKYDPENPDAVVRSVAWRVALWTVAVILFVGLISIALWAFGVFSSDLKGQGDAIKKKNSATNRIAASERFEDRYQEILQADRRIDVLADAAERDPSTVNQTNLTGQINYCLDVVGEYNADARKYTAEEFRAEDLPAQIDNLDPATDCKPSE